MKLRITVSGILSFIVADILKSFHYADKELSLPKSRIALLGLQVPNIAGDCPWKSPLEIVTGIVSGDRRWRSSLEIVAGIVAGNHHWRLVLENVAGNCCWKSLCCWIAETLVRIAKVAYNSR